ncbi:MAG: hypothetical protein ACJ8R9_09630 [Steroidobacteraceae bacterium]
MPWPRLLSFDEICGLEDAQMLHEARQGHRMRRGEVADGGHPSAQGLLVVSTLEASKRVITAAMP